jgi:lysophospholipase L1-like esterase
MNYLNNILVAIAVSVACSNANSAEMHSWYVAPTGKDSHPGTLEKPFASVQRAQEFVNPGDVVFIRGGVYKMQESQIASRKGVFARLMVLDKSGLPDQPITYRAYENEKPIFDCSDVKPVDMRVTVFYVSGSWLRFIGLDITAVQVTIEKHTQSICVESQGSHNIFERLSLHDGQAIGIYHVRGSHNLFYRCDAWNNWDFVSENGKGENVDGFGCHPTKGSVGNVFRECRAWFNSDDGYDCISAHEAVTFENCWAAYNGYSPKFERLANGNGFKVGGYGSHTASELPKLIPRHVVRDCLAVRNKASGFYANHHPGGCDWIANRAYRNGANFNMQNRLIDNTTETPGYGHKLHSNLSYGSRHDLTNVDVAKCELSGNIFADESKLTDQDFVSLSEQGLTQERTADGLLPNSQLLQRSDNLKFYFGDDPTPAGFKRVGPDTIHRPGRYYGYREVSATIENTGASIFCVDVPEGNYLVTVRFGDPHKATNTTVKAEARRLMVERLITEPGKFDTETFCVNVRRPAIGKDRTTTLNQRELGPPISSDWDDQLSFEFNGPHPGVVSLEIQPTRPSITVFVAGDSTVTDQTNEPYAGWGQMLPRFFDANVAIANHAESGLALFSFERQRRLEKILSVMQPGDYLFIQFGHNDQKSKSENAGPFTSYKSDLKMFVTAVRNKKGLPVLVTSMERRRFDGEGKPTATLADYAEAVRQVGKEENVPVIDLNAMSLQLYSALGEEHSKKAFAFYPAETFPGQTKELKDNTHHNNYGAYELARCVVEGIKSNVPALANHLIVNLDTFDPNRPDSPDTILIPPSPFIGNSVMPAGN